MSEITWRRLWAGARAFDEPVVVLIVAVVGVGLILAPPGDHRPRPRGVA